MNSAVLDVAIGMFFIYLLLSLACSTANEWLARWLGLRASNLEKAVSQLLAKDSGVISAFWQHHLIDSSVQKGQKPSYLGAKTFGTVLLDTVAKGGMSAAAAGGPAGGAALRATLTKIANSKIREGLLALFDDANGDVATFRQKVEHWFDDTMDRVSGWYKRQSQLILGILAIVASVGLNVDSLYVAKRLFVEPELRAAVVKEAATSSVSRSSPGNQAASATPEDLRKELQTISVLIGWRCSLLHWDGGWVWLWRFVGWTLTALAISLGAPFWFDLLSKVSNLRAAGCKPKKDGTT